MGREGGGRVKGVARVRMRMLHRSAIINNSCANETMDGGVEFMRPRSETSSFIRQRKPPENQRRTRPRLHEREREREGERERERGERGEGLFPCSWI
jgi:hypothetical protein